MNKVYSWGPLAHLYIIEKACDELGSVCPFANLSSTERQKAMMNAMGPDVFVIVDIIWNIWKVDPNVNIVHSPVPWRYEKDNFGYVMLKESNTDSSKISKSYGWGSHISADWIAHGQVVKIGEWWDIPGTGSHGEFEKLIDHYIVYKTGKKTIVKDWCDGGLVKNSLHNFRRKLKQPWARRIIVIPPAFVINLTANLFTDGGISGKWGGVIQYQNGIINTINTSDQWKLDLQNALKNHKFSGIMETKEGKTVFPEID
jgi:hypothetical protein